MHLRIRFEEAGGHTHFKVFAGQERHMTLGNCGRLCMTNEEFKTFKDMLILGSRHNATVDFLDDAPLSDRELSAKEKIKEDAGFGKDEIV